jgi:hypothetical protein
MTIPSLKPPFRFPLLSVSMRAVFIEVALGWQGLSELYT